MKFIVFGIGSYGSSLATKLTELGHEVFGVDTLHARTEKLKNRITYTVTMDATNKEAIQDLPLKEADAVIIAIGENEGTIILLAALLKQIGVKRIICRVISTLQKTVLETMGLDEFVYPEQNSAERMAHHLSFDGVIDSHRVCDKFRIVEANVPGRLIGSKVTEVDFINEFEIQLVSIKRNFDEKNILGTKRQTKHTLGILVPSTEFRTGDTLILFGESRKIKAFLEH
ncbi:MAG: TrkA family potassium uptake protein [Cyclobacteriaceae bacterium]|nr:TrkA family potassium uptake protein [Cyclobacteriaceae bacterium]